MGTGENLVNYNGEQVSHEAAVQYAGDAHLLSRPHPAGFCPYGCGDGASTTPLADALAVADNRQAWAVASEVDGTRTELEALRALAEAVRASLAEFSEGDVRTLAAAAWELYFEFDSGELLTTRQDEVLGKAYNLFVKNGS